MMPAWTALAAISRRFPDPPFLKISPSRLAVAFVVLVCCSLIFVESWLTWRAYHVQLAESETASANLARSIAQHAYDTFKEADTVLAGLVDRLEYDDMVHTDIDHLRNLLVRRGAELPQLRGLFIYDQDGQWVASSQSILQKNANNSDREYFRYHRSHPESGPHIGPPIRSKSTGEWIVTISRRFNYRDGSFAGIVLASINMDYFRTFYDKFDIGESGAIFIASDEGRLLLRRPFNEQYLGRDISRFPLFQDYLPLASNGTKTFTSSQDGITRINSYRRVQSFPLVVSAALSEYEVLNNWRSDATWQAVGAAGVMVVILVMGFWLFIHIEKHMQTEAELSKAYAAMETLNQTLEMLAMQDGLTGLANRRQFDQKLNQEFSRALRSGSELALLMIDVDRFKQYNDLYGHIAGDACLKLLSKKILTQMKRPGDLCARFGGEELVVLLPETDIAGARRVAECIKAEIQSLQIQHEGSDFGVVTVSIGVDAMIPELGRHVASDLVISADKALYQAKNNGRNQVTSTLHGVT